LERQTMKTDIIDIAIYVGWGIFVGLVIALLMSL
jgi:hypothetical protein